MVIVWLTSLLMAIATISAGVMYHYDVASGLNHEMAIKKALGDNLTVFSNACAYYLTNNKITGTKTLSDQNIDPYIPNGFTKLLNYQAIGAVDSQNKTWLIISFDATTSRKLQTASAYNDILGIVAKDINNQAHALTNGYYQQIYVGTNQNCILTNNTMSNANFENSFNSICNQSPQLFTKNYILMATINS